MCLKAVIIDQRCDRIHALLHAAKTIAAGNAESDITRHTFAGVTTLIAEIERDLGAFAAELKAACQERPAS